MESRRRLQDWHHMLAMSVAIIVVGGGLVYLFLQIDLIPHPASLERGLIDNFVQVLFAIAGFFFAIILVVLSYALIFFRRQPGDDTDSSGIQGKPVLEIAWTMIPLIIVVVLGIVGARVLDKMTATSPDYSSTQSIFSLGAFIPRNVPAAPSTSPDLVIKVTAARFVWKFEYPDYGINSYDLEVPVNNRIRLDMHSEDVIHSFWVQQWGPKQDLVPGLSPSLLITPTEIGEYTVECSQLCGFGHTNMTAPVHVVSIDDFNKWVKQQTTGNTTSPPPGSHVMIDLTAKNIAFDKSTITVPAGVTVMINFDNEDNGVPHNFAVYKTTAAQDKIFSGQIITGPKRITYEFKAPSKPGNYFFRCDVHPTIMTGTFVVK